MLTIHLHLAARLIISGDRLSFPLYAFMAWTETTLPFTFYVHWTVRNFIWHCQQVWDVHCLFSGRAPTTYVVWYDCSTCPVVFITVSQNKTQVPLADSAGSPNSGPRTLKSTIRGLQTIKQYISTSSYNSTFHCPVTSFPFVTRWCFCTSVST